MKYLILTLFTLSACITPAPVPSTPTPTPVPTATPKPKCPTCLVKWSMNTYPYIGGAGLNKEGIFDTTPRYARETGDTVGVPDNSEHPNFGGICEDKRGPDFTYSQTGTTSRFVVAPGPNNNPFQIKVFFGSGTTTITASPRDDMQDANGYPESVCTWIKDASQTDTFTF